jgi:hypothetical protein
MGGNRARLSRYMKLCIADMEMKKGKGLAHRQKRCIPSKASPYMSKGEHSLELRHVVYVFLSCNPPWDVPQYPHIQQPPACLSLPRSV